MTKLDGVKKVNVDVKKKTATVTVAKNELNKKQVNAALGNGRYKLTSITNKKDVYTVHITGMS